MLIYLDRMSEQAAGAAFRYHPDPVTTGSAISSESACDICGVARGFIYNGPIFGEQPEALCLHCIASGRAAVTLGRPDGPAEFTDVGVEVPEGVPDQVLAEVAHRTPGFRGWQQERWLYHCHDAAAFLGPVGFPELERHPDALDMVLHENDEYGWSAQQCRAYVQQLSKVGDATAYLFRCLSCGKYLAYSDMS